MTGSRAARDGTQAAVPDTEPDQFKRKHPDLSVDIKCSHGPDRGSSLDWSLRDKAQSGRRPRACRVRASRRDPSAWSTFGMSPNGCGDDLRQHSMGPPAWALTTRLAARRGACSRWEGRPGGLRDARPVRRIRRARSSWPGSRYLAGSPSASACTWPGTGPAVGVAVTGLPDGLQLLSHIRTAIFAAVLSRI